MLDDELRALVSVDPSPDFQARVRTRVSREPARVGWLGMMAAAVALAAVVVAVALVFPIGEPRHESDPSPRLLSATYPAVEFVGLVPPAAAHGRPQPVRLSASRVADPQPSVQIDRAEARALHRLFSSPVPIVVIDGWKTGDVREVAIPSISIEPLVVDIRSEGDRQ